MQVENGIFYTDVNIQHLKIFKKSEFEISKGNVLWIIRDLQHSPEVMMVVQNWSESNIMLVSLVSLLL